MKIFIGSSSESIEIAEEIARIIEGKGHTPLLWEDYFRPGDFTLKKIMELPDEVDAGIFVLAPDDKVVSRGEPVSVPRDNVLIEAGILFGKLGERCVALCRVPGTKMASDFAGMVYLQYEPEKKYNFKNQLDQWLAGILRVR